ncbi:ABC-F family ATP-binding cassette domain-containing protein [Nonomuraea roseoviolacea subsp. carminata]|uniref:Macrolide transport system ATP-binding/permease protein n=1 Tax=Nonomuraea roseoviolacea subsp. carminata TaxID=160689 RepID=A0ABT1K1C6_9ACTN|nr:TlrC/CarA/OleB/SrmB family ABC-F type ribosomal protection protein [Nonomuraea roseoviolacea]MCP2347472.1 macrolide transport system ATP-binding/permease protein [Nonomuraea roseoviolacea subsp. carminata]
MRAAQLSLSELSLSEVTKRYGERVVLDRVTFAVKPGERVGVIGDNGSGKSTLLRLMAGVERPDNGELVVRAPGGVGHLPQTLGLPPEASVADVIDRALADVRALEARIRDAERALTEATTDASAALDAYGALLAEFEARGGYTADARVDVALHGLGLPGLDRGRRLGTLSGGERSRLALAATLAAAPELLLLDEPTNDLDDEAVAWLERHLREHRGTVVAITHDRVFLDRVTSTILEVADGRVSRYGNGYSGYLTAKAAERHRRIQAYEDWTAEVARQTSIAESNIARMHAIPRKVPLAVNGSGAFRARSRAHGAMGRIRRARQRTEWLRANPVPPPPRPLRFTAEPLTAHRDDSGAGVELRDVVVAGRLRLGELTIPPGGRLLVTGPNGAGKTTLMRVLAGELAPDQGSVRRPARVGLLRQEEATGPLNRTVLRAYADGRPGTLDEHADALLALGLFRPADLRLRVGELSYGQRRRIELARLVSAPVDLLLLDEPTNHLSPALVEQMEEALEAYRGMLVIVTHDRRLREGFTGSRLELSGHGST